MTASAESPREEWPVHLIRFDSTRPITVPGAMVASSLVSNHQENRGGHTITYLPRLRHFKVCFVDHQGRRSISWIHESNILSWDAEPAPKG